jgi:hypothetical protein
MRRADDIAPTNGPCRYRWIYLADYLPSLFRACGTLDALYHRITDLKPNHDTDTMVLMNVFYHRILRRSFRDFMRLTRIPRSYQPSLSSPGSVVKAKFGDATLRTKPTASWPSLPRRGFGSLRRLAGKYTKAQRSRPYVTQFCSAMVIYFCADVSAQYIGGKEFDPKRTARSLTIGAIACIPGYKW